MARRLTIMAAVLALGTLPAAGQSVEQFQMRRNLEESQRALDRLARQREVEARAHQRELQRRAERDALELRLRQDRRVGPSLPNDRPLR